MRIATPLYLGMLLGLFAGTATVSSPAAAAPMACAAGYHVDSRGNCQPNDGYVDDRCPAGQETTPWPDPPGYRCVSIPRGY